jgi:transglutaminase-like putative cysteine protease
MSKRIFIGLIVALIITQFLSGCTWFTDEPDHAEGFAETDLIAPSVPSYLPHPDVELPQENESQLAPGFSYNMVWAIGEVFALWGGFLKVTIENTGNNDLFIYRCGIEVNWSTPREWIYEERAVLIPIGEEKDLGTVYYSAPDVEGYFEYNVIISLLVKDNELFDSYGVESWYDNGTAHGRENELYVIPLEYSRDTKIEHNYKPYYDKLKSRIDFENDEVLNLVSQLTASYPGDYNIYQVLAIFEYMLNDLDYISDPSERDYWATCSETIERGGGDCEDLSILFSSMIGAIGGTTRIYLTHGHAFSALYIGDYASKNAILDAIRLFYGTDPNFVIFVEGEDYWLASDPAGTLYMGGLPADCQPALASENPPSFGFNFEDTKKIHVIDITG